MIADDHARGEWGHPMITASQGRGGGSFYKLSLLDNTYTNVRKQWIFYIIMMKMDYNKLI